VNLRSLEPRELQAAGVTGISARIAAKQQIAAAGLLRK